MNQQAITANSKTNKLSNYPKKCIYLLLPSPGSLSGETGHPSTPNRIRLPLNADRGEKYRYLAVTFLRNGIPTTNSCLALMPGSTCRKT